MKITEFVKKEVSGWKSYEVAIIIFSVAVILYNAIFLHDNIIAVLSSICGILYTIIAGKGKVSCYFFGLAGSGCYITLAFLNALWGNALLYLCYYIPMQILGIFKWKKHLKSDTAEIIKSKLSYKNRLFFVLVSFVGCFLSIYILKYFNDKSPVIDGITTFLSVLGMYFTVRRLTEQWIVWIVVNGLSFIMWLNIVLNGSKVYSTLVMWGVYFILAIYFYVTWNKETKISLEKC